jgi:hypothetical protein
LRIALRFIGLRLGLRISRLWIFWLRLVWHRLLWSAPCLFRRLRLWAIVLRQRTGMCRRLRMRQRRGVRIGLQRRRLKRARNQETEADRRRQFRASAITHV